MDTKRWSRLLVAVILVMCLLGADGAYGQEGREIIVNLPEFRLYVYENGLPIRQYPIGIGNVLQPSLLGRTEIKNKVIDPTYYPIRWWERGLEPIPPGPDNPVGTRWLGLGFPSYGIHGTNNPDSIGRAMSAGCIRMYNEDVEELADLVDVGTPVTLMYETIFLQRDPILETESITVYRDIYNYGTNTAERAMEKALQRGWSPLYGPALDTVLSEAAGRPTPLATKIPVQFSDGHDLGENSPGDPLIGVKYGGEYFIALPEPWQKEWEEEVASRLQSTRHWDRLFVKAGDLAEILGLGLFVDERINLVDVGIFLEDQRLDVHSRIKGSELYLPVDEMSAALHLPLAFAKESPDYLPQKEWARWGIRLDWTFPQAKAYVQTPQAYLGDIYLGRSVMIEDNSFLIPATVLKEQFDVDMKWLPSENVVLFNGSYGIEGTRIGDTVFVPDWVISWLMPGAELRVVCP